MTEDAKKENKAFHEHHMSTKTEVRKLMLNDKQRALQDKTTCCANYDLQKIMTPPKSNVSIMYYLSKLSVWNFTVFELGVAQGHCFVWNETIGNRGSNEISSYVFSFLQQKTQSGVNKF